MKSLHTDLFPGGIFKITDTETDLQGTHRKLLKVFRKKWGFSTQTWENRMGGFRKGGVFKQQICPQTRRRNSKPSEDFKKEFPCNKRFPCEENAACSTIWKPPSWNPPHSRFPTNCPFPRWWEMVFFWPRNLRPFNPPRGVLGPFGPKDGIGVEMSSRPRGPKS